MDNKSVLYQLMDTRMGEALHKITKEDAVFIFRPVRSMQLKLLRSMVLLKGVI